MLESIIVALITGIFAVVGNLIVSGNAKRKDDIERAKRQQIVDDKLAAIEHKLDIHNGYAEKFTEIQMDIAVIKTEIKNIKE